MGLGKMDFEKIQKTMKKIDRVYFNGGELSFMRNLLGREPNQFDEQLVRIDGYLARLWEVSPGMTKQKEKLLQAKKELLDIIKMIPPEPIPTNDEEDLGDEY
jgi:hypothetical protein